MRKIKIENELYERVKQIAQNDGYSSIEEFVAHVLERELKRPTASNSDEKILERLKGLGYIS